MKGLWVAGFGLLGPARVSGRWGRANLVAYGLVVVAVVVSFGFPNAPNGWVYAILVSVVGFVEGIVLVATPALVREFSPQRRRGSAMGFWTLGPLMGSLIVAEVASHTLAPGITPPWRNQFLICGVVGFVIAALAVLTLKELSPRLRDQRMVSMRDLALIEARAAKIDTSQLLGHPWRQMLHLDVIGPALGMSLQLIIYYTAVGFFVIYFETVFGFSAHQANGLDNWFWAVDAGALVITGLLSDRLMVRKPFMLIGILGTIAMTIVFLLQAGNSSTGYYTLVWMLCALAVFRAASYTPWMAAFTETVEKRNPALVATGLAVWGWMLRVVVAVSVFVVPFVVTSITPLVEYGPQVKASVAVLEKAPLVSVPYSSSRQELLRVVETHERTFRTLSSYRDPKSIPASVLTAAEKAVGIPALLEARKYAAALHRLATEGALVVKAKETNAIQWQHWFWICVAGEAAFVPFIFLLVGRWRPSRARTDSDAYNRRVAEELARVREGFESNDQRVR